MGNAFGERIKQVRRRQAISQRDLAAHVCIEESYLKKIEQGYSPPPSAPVITALASALRIDSDALFALAGKLPPDVMKMLIDYPQLVQVVRAASVEMGINPTAVEDDRRPRREPVSRELKTLVFNLDHHECVYCSAPAVLQVDHVYPSSLGGTTEPDNLVTCCDRCNQKKNDRPKPPPMVFGRFRTQIED